jgi:hypothetical protein
VGARKDSALTPVALRRLDGIPGSRAFYWSRAKLRDESSERWKARSSLARAEVERVAWTRVAGTEDGRMLRSPIVGIPGPIQ